MLTSSFGSISSPLDLLASLAITSLAFIFELVPEPVWKTSKGNCSLCLLCQTSFAAFDMAFAFFVESRPRLLFALAAASLIIPNVSIKELVKGKSILIPLIGKLSIALCVCGPHKALKGIFTSPKVSFSIL